MTTEDADRLKRLASGRVDELSIGYDAVKATFEQDGERYIRRLLTRLRSAVLQGRCAAHLAAHLLRSYRP